MNNGAFGENFPYSNFHDLNMDWIIKIAKDFLDQYTHIQEVITSGEESLSTLTTEGLEQLQTKADELETLLQQWYETHSNDIAEQLADAIADLNTELANNIAEFNERANQKAEETIATIPSDYTALANKVENTAQMNEVSKLAFIQSMKETYNLLHVQSNELKAQGVGSIDSTQTGVQIAFNSAGNLRHCYIDVTPGELIYVLQRMRGGLSEYQIVFTDSNDIIISLENLGDGTVRMEENIVLVPAGATRLYTASQASQYPSTSNNLYQIKRVVKNTEETDMLSSNNAEFTSGYWNDINMNSASATSQNFVSLKVNLAPGEYCLKTEIPIDIVRFIINGKYITATIEMSDEGFVFYVPTEQIVGISWILRDHSVWGTNYITLTKNDVGTIRYNTYIDFFARTEHTNKIKTIDRKYLLNGYYNESEYVQGLTRICTLDRIPINKGDIILIHNDYAVAVQYYDESNSYITAVGYFSNKYLNPSSIQSSVIKSNYDGYITFQFYNPAVSGNITPTDYDDIITIIPYTIYDTIKEYKGTETPHKGTLLMENVGNQGICIINNQIWTFDDNGTITIIDIATNNVTTKTHALGHCNSVDYDPATHTLMIYASQGDNKPILYLYRYPEDSNNLTENDQNCTIVALYTPSSFMNVSASVCFGEDKMFIYYIEGVYKNATYAIETNPKIHKLLLGMGTNDLSSEGYGTFIPGRTGTEYNGTVKLIHTYEGKIISGVNVFSTGNSLWTPQDSKFNGYLYVGFGTCGCNVAKIRLYDDTFEVVDNIRTEAYDFEGTIYQVEPEGFAMTPTHYYITNTDRTSHITRLYRIDK